MSVRLEIARNDGLVAEKPAERDQHAERDLLDCRRRIGEDDDIGEFARDHRALNWPRPSLAVDFAVVGQAEEHADQHFEAVGVDMCTVGCGGDFDKDVDLPGAARVPPVMRDAGLDGRRLTGRERHRLARDACVERAFQHREFLGHERMKVLAHHRGARAGGKVGDAGPVTAILAAAQHDRIFAGDPVFIDVPAPRHSLFPSNKSMSAGSFGLHPVPVSLPNDAARCGKASRSGFFFLSCG